MAKVTIHLPRGVSEEKVRAVVERYVKVKLRILEALDRLLAERRLGDEELEKFERFRDEFWRKKKRVRIIVNSSILISYLAKAGYIRRYYK